MSKEDKLLVDSLGRHRFENAYVVLPNPFELGEYVRLIGTTEVGYVDVSQDEGQIMGICGIPKRFG